MASNVKKEIELYEPMRIWLQKYLEDKYKGAHIVTVDSHARTLDVILEDYGMIDHYPQTVGLDIQIDVLGIIVKGGKSAYRIWIYVWPSGQEAAVHGSGVCTDL